MASQLKSTAQVVWRCRPFTQKSRGNLHSPNPFLPREVIKPGLISGLWTGLDSGLDWILDWSETVSDVSLSHCTLSVYPDRSYLPVCVFFFTWPTAEELEIIFIRFGNSSIGWMLDSPL